MKNQDLVKEKQKETLSQFYSNLSLAILSIGVIAPLFNQIDNVLRLTLGAMFSLIVAGFFLKKSLIIFE